MGEFAAARLLQEANVAAFATTTRCFRVGQVSFLSYLEGLGGQGRRRSRTTARSVRHLRGSGRLPLDGARLLIAAATACSLASSSCRATERAYGRLAEPLGEIATPCRPRAAGPGGTGTSGLVTRHSSARTPRRALSAGDIAACSSVRTRAGSSRARVSTGRGSTHPGILEPEEDELPSWQIVPRDSESRPGGGRRSLGGRLLCSVIDGSVVNCCGGWIRHAGTWRWPCARRRRAAPPLARAASAGGRSRTSSPTHSRWRRPFPRVPQAEPVWCSRSSARDDPHGGSGPSTGVRLGALIAGNRSRPTPTARVAARRWRWH